MGSSSKVIIWIHLKENYKSLPPPSKKPMGEVQAQQRSVIRLRWTSPAFGTGDQNSRAPGWLGMWFLLSCQKPRFLFFSFRGSALRGESVRHTGGCIVRFSKASSIFKKCLPLWIVSLKIAMNPLDYQLITKSVDNWDKSVGHCVSAKLLNGNRVFCIVSCRVKMMVVSLQVI